ncbi:hypothetical protein Vretimale_12499 [Volvox reticuliferus]|uniref:TraB domain-containing protein n=1 Tax=Volvox reticuliferus TaxID=1737510 RepID=A0A8J4CFD1_9CHLO|nr:hypothetical protein Vretifemale_9152 [Volvox reticuliferus]GIM08525.1 hypothetical protein Vretimale_12499 [Volvox reticuliferus]
MDLFVRMRSSNTTSWLAPHRALLHFSPRTYMRVAYLSSNALLPETRSSAAVSEKGSASTYDAELQRLLLAGPPTDFDFRTEVTTSSCQWVDDIAPQLRDLVDDGTVVVVPRRPDYQERRTDGYCEPRVVVLVGTAHVSRRSQQDVDRVIRAVVPDSVVVELCKSRSAALMATGDLSPSGTSPGWAAAGTTTTPAGSISGSDSDSDLGFGDAAWLKDGAAASSLCNSRSSSSPSLPAYVNPMNLAGGGDDGGGRGGGALPGVGFLGAVARSVSLGGQSALLLRVLLAGLASRTAGSLGVTGGGEFAAARAAAEDVGAQVVLGDRPVEITLSRAWAALPLTRRLKLCGELLRGALGTTQQALSEELVEKLKSDDAVSAFFSQLSNSYPELVAPLVTERDLYLAWSLKRSKAVNGAGVVVGVVGRGHLRGVVYTLLRDQGGAGLRFSDLVEGRNSRRRRREQASQGLQRLFIEVLFGAAAYFTWLAFQQEL